MVRFDRFISIYFPVSDRSNLNSRPNLAKHNLICIIWTPNIDIQMAIASWWDFEKLPESKDTQCLYLKYRIEKFATKIHTNNTTSHVSSRSFPNVKAKHPCKARRLS